MARPVEPAWRKFVGRRYPRLQCLRAVVTRVVGQRALGVIEDVGMVFGTPLEAAQNLARMRIEQQLVRIEAVPVLRLIRSVRAQAVDQAGRGTGQETMKHAVMRAE
jgi:hypothetical protein